ncbi:hypothetical protein [Prosthecobacter sp.]|uniref:hypothetical protein n=1 Tax=Prosthecobacter sp. TaxID=1965333 RepID=UPI003784D550
MSKQVINLGTTPSDGTGDSVRTAFSKTKQNFDELYEAVENAAGADELEEHVGDTNNPHNVTKSQVGLGNADNTSDANKPISNATQTALNAKADSSSLSAEAATRASADSTNAAAIAAETAARIAADALKADLVGGVIPTAQIPAIAISAFLGSVGSEAAMLALSGQSGDWCNRSDTSTAWVIVGSNPAQLSSWAQINYPASPVQSVNGQSGTIVLGKADVGLGNADNTSDANKPVSTATQTALNLKQDASSLGADSAAAVHAATSKSTPANSDEIGLVDSAASYGLKKLTWTNLKTALGTVFAALAHAPRHKSGGLDAIKLDELAAPTDVTTLNATTSAHGLCPKFPGGTTDFLRADGNFAAPAGGGGGGALVRGTGTLQGNTTPRGADGPASGAIYLNSVTGSGTITINANGTDTFIVTFSPSDPADGSYWVDDTGFDTTAYANALDAALPSFGSFIASISRSEYNFTFLGVATGAASYLDVSSTMPGAVTSGMTLGTDGAEGTGAIVEAIVTDAVPGKKTYPVRIFIFGDGGMAGVNMEVGLKVDGTFFPLAPEFAANITHAELLSGLGFAPIGANEALWMSGMMNAALVARLTTPSGDGGMVNISAICEQA